jgi:hypothetical protein
MNLEIFTMLIGFICLFFAIIQTNNSTNSRIDNLRMEIDSKIDKVENRFEDDIKELRGLILGLYSPRLLTQLDKSDKDAA